MTVPEHVWMVRAGNDNSLAPKLWDANAVAIGWRDLGDLSQLSTRDAVKDRYAEVYPADVEKKYRIAVNSGQLYRFAHEIQIGDYMLSYLQSSREIVIGEVISDYRFDPDVFSEHYPHIRTVVWHNKISRDDLSENAQKSTGSTLTVFNLDEYAEEFYHHALSMPYYPEGDDTSVFLNTDQLIAIFKHTNIPPGQMNLFKLLYENDPRGLTLKELAEMMRDGDLRSMQGVLNGLSRRIAETNKIPNVATPKYQVFFFIEGEGPYTRFRLFPEAKQAIDSIPEFIEVINTHSVDQIYSKFPYDNGAGGLAII